ncbi:MAG: nickel transporter permease NikB [Methanosaeta sp. PtaU1.Bin060]|jgi:peptide/nickel transport system permease protein|nr:MAG: nickel transporter permease NikB [Methanosaeta sp. PtaU1.Bin060]
MWRYLFGRLLLLIIVVIGVTALTFLMMYYTPGDPAAIIAIARYGGPESLSSDLISWIRHQEGLDAPIYIQYAKWLHHIFYLDMGRSLITDEPVFDKIFSRFPATLQLALASMLIYLLIAIPIGILSAVKQNSLIDYLSDIGVLVGVSMPSFWLALILILFFSIYLGWLPVCGSQGLSYLILPATTLGIGIAATTTRIVRSSMLDVLGQNYIRTARAKGLKEAIVIGKHALKNAMIPIVTIAGLQFASLLEGAVVVETIFAWPGVGRLLVDSINQRDFPMIQGCVLFIAIIFVLANLLVDCSYVYLDPRVRYNRRHQV